MIDVFAQLFQMRWQYIGKLYSIKLYWKRRDTELLITVSLQVLLGKSLEW